MIDLAALRREQWEPRTREIPAPRLASGDGETPKWKVRAPTATDLALSRDAEANRQRLDAVVTALERGKKSDAVLELRENLGLGDAVPADIARRIELLVQCSVEPECSQEDAVWLGEHDPVLFYEISNTILELAGQGSSVKKTQKPSTTSQA